MSVNVAYGQVNLPMVPETSALAPPEVYEEFNTLADAGKKCQSGSGDQMVADLYASADETPAIRKSQPPINDDGQPIFSQMSQ